MFCFLLHLFLPLPVVLFKLLKLARFKKGETFHRWFRGERSREQKFTNFFTNRRRSRAAVLLLFFCHRHRLILHCFFFFFVVFVSRRVCVESAQRGFQEASFTTARILGVFLLHCKVVPVSRFWFVWWCRQSEI